MVNCVSLISDFDKIRSDIKGLHDTDKTIRKKSDVNDPIQ